MSSGQDKSSLNVLKSWSFWIPIGISGALSIAALAVSIYSGYVSKQARHDARAINKLDIHPIVELSTNFQGIRGKPPYFIVKNSGPIPVEQLEIQLVSHRYTPERGGEVGFGISVYGTKELYRVARLEPWSGRVFEFPKHWLEVNARIQKPLHHNMIEIRLTYRRSVDLITYEASAFYFINPDRLWVSENDGSLSPDVYDRIKTAAFKASEKEIRNLRQDTLHRIVRPE